MKDCETRDERAVRVVLMLLAIMVIYAVGAITTGGMIS
jgi:hypothetical protein